MRQGKPTEPTQGQINARLKAAQLGAKSLLESERKRAALSLGLTAPEWKEIDHWASARGIGDRLEAIRELVALGLKASAKEEKPAEEPAKPKKAKAAKSHG
jgi:hypothetical protein